MAHCVMLTSKTADCAHFRTLLAPTCRNIVNCCTSTSAFPIVSRNLQSNGRCVRMQKFRKRMVSTTRNRVNVKSVGGRPSSSFEIKGSVAGSPCCQFANFCSNLNRDEAISKMSSDSWQPTLLPYKTSKTSLMSLYKVL